MTTLPRRIDWLAAKGETGRLIAAHPWADTPLGPLSNWPDHLRGSINFVLNAGAPMALIWGAEHRIFYNDRYAQIIRDKHPAAIGRLARDVW